MSRRPVLLSRALHAVLATTLTLVSLAVLAVSDPAAAGTASVADDPCGPSGNAITCENSKPGSPPSVWDIDGSGADDIQGFSTAISVNVGSKVDFKIDTTAAAYTVDIYRTGWYNGDGARKIASVTPLATLPQTQPQCITDVSTELYDCGNWAVSASWNVPSDAVSGVYLAVLQRTDNGDRSHITFVVRNDASHSALIYQTSDQTWQAYNLYGGSDYYNGAANGRAYQVSYNRPVVTRGENSGRDFYFSAEYPAVRFLERNGYDVSYQSGIDTSLGTNPLTNHRVFLSVGHDEYWTGPQRAKVEAARDAGVDLAFLSGNEMYWHTRLAPSADASHTDNRTLVCYKETWADAKIDPSSEWTGTWRDPRFASPGQGAGRPENAVTGTLFQANHDDLAVQVSAAEGRNRLWRTTSLASLSAGSTATLAAHTVGYESDEDLDNGFRPAGLIDLSTTTGSTPQYLTDFGNTVVPGMTTHHLTLYRAASGALVFSAGSIQFTWGLDATHDSGFDPVPADPRIQQAVVNLLADMGAQPLTLMSSLTAATASADTTGPSASITSPSAGATLANGTQLTVTGTATDSGGGVVAGVEVSTDNGDTWHPATGTSSWSYAYVQHGQGAQTIRVRATDDSANLGSVASVAVTVTCPCSVYGAMVPAVAAADDSGATELGLQFTPDVDGFVTGVRFYKGAGNSGTHVGSLWSAAGQRLAQVTFAGETATGWQTASFTSAVAVTAGATYTVSYSAPAGHYAAKQYAFSTGPLRSAPLTVAGGYAAPPAGVFADAGSFPTRSSKDSSYYVDPVFNTVDTSPLTLTSTSPLAGSTSVPRSTTVGAGFSRAADAGTVSIAVTGPSGASMTGATTYDAASRTATFTPAAALAAATAYTATMTAKDTTGAALTGTRSWSFTTAAAPSPAGVCPCTLFDDESTPSTLAANDRGDVTLGVSLTPTVDGTVSAIRFYKGPDNTGTHTGTLWSATGTALASGTFTGESTQGWQTLTFSTPVAVIGGTTYVAAYRAPVGSYSLGPAFNTAGLSRGPLSVTSSAGAYVYGSGFPGNATSSDYLVDVVFTKTDPALAIATIDPPAGAVDVARGSKVGVTFNQAVKPGVSLTATVGGTALAGTASLDTTASVLTFTPAATLPGATVVTMSLTGAAAVTGGTSLGTQTWTFTTRDPSDDARQTIYGDAQPQTMSASDNGPIEVGTAFTPGKDGIVKALRFLKGAGNGGTHVGSLWGADGTRLAQVTFANETASGWQRAVLASPVRVTAGTTYVVSYLAPQGHYSATPGYFTSPVTSGQLTAPGGNNGRYLYGAAGGLPTDSYGSTAYFADVEYYPDVPTLSVAAQTPAPGATGVDRSSAPTATFSSALATGWSMRATVGTTSVAGAATLSGDGRTLTFTPSPALPADADVTVTVTGIRSTAGATLADLSWTFHTKPAPTVVVSGLTPASGASAADQAVAPSATFSAALATGWSMQATTGGNAVAGAAALSSDARTLTFTPTSLLPADSDVTVTVSGIRSTEGATLADVTWSFHTKPLSLVNLAAGQVTSQSSTYSSAYPASRAVDGNTSGVLANNSSSSTTSSSQPWWQVDLGAVSTVRTVTLWNRTDCCADRLANGIVFLSSTDMSGRTYAQLQADPSVTELPFGTLTGASLALAASDARARYVRVQLSGTTFLTLAEVQVWGPNLAAGRAASQSSTYSTQVASRAVDGTTDGATYTTNSVSSTQASSQPWWQVDLGTPSTVNAVTIWNRTDCCTDRLTNAVVLLSATDMTGRTYAQLNADPLVTKIPLGTVSATRVTVPANGVTARYVRVQQPGTTGSEVVNLAELQVNGVPLSASADTSPVVNLALGQVVAQSSTYPGYPGSRAVDGNTSGVLANNSSSSTTSSSQPWWQVDLGAVSTVRTVTLWNRTDCCADRLANGIVFLSSTDMSGRTYAQLQADPSVTELPFGTLTGASLALAASDARARYVRVQLSGTNFLTLAEVQVWGPNLAAGKQTSQSSLAYSGSANRAVDGNTDGVFNNGSVTHTDFTVQPWWQVDLGSPSTVNAVTVWNRTDCCATRLNNAVLLVSATDMTGRTYAQLNADPLVTKIPLGTITAARTVVPLNGITGRYVRVQQPGTAGGDVISLAEIQVNGRR